MSNQWLENFIIKFTLKAIDSDACRGKLLKLGFSQQSAIKSHLRASLKLGHFGCFDASIIMRDKVGEYGLEGNISIALQHEESEILSLDYIL